MLRASFLLFAVLVATTAARADEPKAPPAAPPAPAAEGGSWIAEYDQLWMQRDDARILQRLYKVLQAQVKNNEADFELQWRLAAWYNWDANNYPDGDLKAGLGQRGWAAGDRAVELKPDDVRAQYNAAVGLGLYSEGVGILNALAKGLEGKFRSRIQAALHADKDYLDGAPQVVWGRFFYKLPWPKRDLDESVKVLRAAVASHPTNLRAKLFLAQSLFKDGKKAEAKPLIDEIKAAPVGKDPAEDKKVKDETGKWFEENKGDF